MENERQELEDRIETLILQMKADPRSNDPKPAELLKIYSLEYRRITGTYYRSKHE